MVSLVPKMTNQPCMNSRTSTSNSKSPNTIRMTSVSFNSQTKSTIGLDTQIDSSSKRVNGTQTLTETVSNNNNSQGDLLNREAWTIQTELLSQ